jgi:nucleoside-diphosphate-sugar epimerase
MFDWAGKKVLVAGGAGLIGSYVVEELVAHGAEVTVADDLSRGTTSNLANVRDTLNKAANSTLPGQPQTRYLLALQPLIIADLRIFSNAMEACRGQDVLIQLASPSYGVGYSGKNHGKMFTDSIRIGFNMLEAARLQKVDRTLIVSSSCVYPDRSPIPTPERWGERNEPEAANEGYGWGKLMIERQAQYYRHDYNMQISIARPFNTYGPRIPVYKDDRDPVIVALMVRALTTEGPMLVWGSGKQARAFLHAKDVASVLVHMAELTYSPWPVNIGSDVPVEMTDLAQRILNAAGCGGREIICNKMRTQGVLRKAARAPEVKRVMALQERELIGLDEGLKEMCEYVKEQLAKKAN